MTAVVADAYDQEPATEPATVGALNAKFASPNGYDTFDQLKVGVARPTVTVIVTVPPDT